MDITALLGMVGFKTETLDNLIDEGKQKMAEYDARLASTEALLGEIKTRLDGLEALLSDIKSTLNKLEA